MNNCLQTANYCRHCGTPIRFRPRLYFKQGEKSYDPSIEPEKLKARRVGSCGCWENPKPLSGGASSG